GRLSSTLTPRPLAAFPWGSMSTSRMRLPSSAAQALRLIAVVVLPTPPFWLATAITLPMNRLHPCGVLVLVAGTNQRSQTKPVPHGGSTVFSPSFLRAGGLCVARGNRAMFHVKPVRQGRGGHMMLRGCPCERRSERSRRSDVSRETFGQSGVAPTRSADQ